MRKDLHEQNRLSWNAATPAHNRHKGDQAAFFRAGGHTLFPEEIALLGDVRGQSLAHLQCNAGQDTLSVASLLGARVTGVDISDEAIGFARQLSADAGIPGEFVRADLFDWFDACRADGTRFDVAFASYGALGWLSDIAAWGRGVASVLKPGGRVVVVEFHPAMWMFDERWAHVYPYSTHGQPLPEPKGVNDYVDASAGGLWPEAQAPAGPWQNPHPAVSFPWGLGEVVQAVIDGGLVLERLDEWPYSNGFKPFERMTEGPGRRWFVPEDKPEVPMMFGIAARKP